MSETVSAGPGPSPVNLQTLLEPRSVAIVGASAEPKKLSGMIVGFLAASGYAGRVYPINPRHPRIGALACYPSVEALPETVDLLVCVVPVAAAFGAIEAAARRGVPYCLLMTGGFGEGRTGAEGEARHRRLLEICRVSGMHVVGPNTVGMVNFCARLPLTFADWYGRDTGCRGGVAIVTHSGSVGGLIFSSLQLAGIGVDYWLGLGNEATLETADFIAHFAADPSVHTVVCYLEGVGNGRSFMRAAAQARQHGKHVVALRAGGHPESARSTAAHTGKHPTRSDVYAGIFRQLGVIDVASLAELAHAMTLLATFGSRIGPRIGILSASGGACSLLADHVIDAGLALPELPRALQQQLDRAIPEYGSSLNPVDLSADVVSRGEILHGTLEALCADPCIDVWLVFGRPIVDRYAEALVEFARRSGQPVIVSCGVAPEPPIRDLLRGGGIAVLDDPALCLQALGSICRALGVKPADARPGSEQDGVVPHARAGAKGGTIASTRTERQTKPAGDPPAQGADAGWTSAPGAGHDARIAEVPVLEATIEHDPDFGPVVALEVAGLARRIVRALPASAADLRDAAAELGACNRRLAESSAGVVAALERLIAATPAGGETRATIGIDA